MKKKIYLAVLAACVALAVAGCGQDKTETKESATKEESGDKDTKDTDTESEDGAIDEEAADELGEAEEDKAEKESTEPARLVSVDKLEDYIKVGEYKGIEVEQVSVLVSEEQIESYMIDSMGAGVEVSGGTVESGDTVTIDYVGTKDGEEFDGGSAEGYDLLIGSGQFIEGFEEGLIGAKKGETRSLDLSFPEDYDKAPEMAGQPVNFKVTIQKIMRPELTDEWVAANTDYKTIEEYRTASGEMLQAYADQSARSTMINAAWQKLLVASEVIEYPEEDIENEKEIYQNKIQLYADQGEMELEEFIEAQGQTMEDYEKQVQQYAEAKVKQNMIIQYILDEEGIRLDDAESLAVQEQMITAYGVEDMAALVDLLGQTQVDESVGIVRVGEVLVDNAVMIEPATDTETEEE